MRSKPIFQKLFRCFKNLQKKAYQRGNRYWFFEFSIFKTNLFKHCSLLIKFFIFLFFRALASSMVQVCMGIQAKQRYSGFSHFYCTYLSILGSAIRYSKNKIDSFYSSQSFTLHLLHLEAIQWLK